MTYEESGDLSFQKSMLEELIKGFNVDLNNLKGELEERMEGSMRMLDLANLQGEF